MNVALRVAETYSVGEEADEDKTSLSEQTDKPESVTSCRSAGAASYVRSYGGRGTTKFSEIDANFHFFQKMATFRGEAHPLAHSSTTSTSVIPTFTVPSVDSTGLLGSFIDSNTLFSFALDLAKQNEPPRY